MITLTGAATGNKFTLHGSDIKLMKAVENERFEEIQEFGELTGTLIYFTKGFPFDKILVSESVTVIKRKIKNDS